MFGLGPHWGFIVGAYALAGLVMVGLVVWVLADLKAQRRILADLEARGVRRRSARDTDPGAGEP
ncbi:heme exporter protein CcmD [Prosthecomicrobium sp. N25]|uniref:heme exporter protein CcmD n=1 Tax=Prosthecomicrobium sp. N25 TaxID=3129254 RepID=UPI003077975F